ncbi:MAG TPA: diguanylate cyclase [Thermodesulfobacteriota bacterium]
MASFFRFNLAKKMLLAFLPLGLLIVLIAAFILSRLEQLNEINNSIIRTEIVIIEATNKMIDLLIDQELYGRRYAILKSKDMLKLFEERCEQFEDLVAEIRSLTDQDGIPIDQIASLHEEYENLFLNGFNILRKPSSSRAKKHNEEIKEIQQKLIDLLKDTSSKAYQNRNKKTLMITVIGKEAFQITALVSIFGIALCIGAALLISRNIINSINQLRSATQEISEGKFDQIHTIQNDDELGELSQAFSEMAKRVKALEEMYLDANPLTKLPGSIAIENIIKKRLDAGSPMAFCFVDIDSFKSFNDRYGYVRGNELLKFTAKTIEAKVAEHGGEGDVVGHIGGDDFVFVTPLERFEKTCADIIEEFDKTIPDFYDPEERDKGYITGVTRQGEEVSFPILTLSIVVVTNRRREIESHIQVGEIAAELKSYAKSLRGSVSVVDRRAT